MNDDRDASFRANTRRAIAAFEAVGFFAQTRSWQTSPLPARSNPERDLERLAGMLCGLRHLTDQFSGLRFHDVLSTANGRTGLQPYCDLSIDGDATALLHALGETEWMTDANHGYRVSLVLAYADAYKQASQNGPPAAVTPARAAARDFPSLHLPSPEARAPSSPDAAGPGRAQPRPGPEHRARRRT